MKSPTLEEWSRMKERRTRAAPSPQQASEGAPSLPEDLFLPDDYVGPATAPEGAERRVERRQFVRFDKTWAEKLLPLMNPMARLALVLLAKADFERHIKATSKTAKAGLLTLKQQRELLLQMERLELISIERRGRGRAQIVTPLRLGGRPDRR
jgi:hypothetical protein